MPEPDRQPAERPPRWRPSFQFIQSCTVLVLILVLCTISAVQTHTFLTWRNLVQTLLTNVSYQGIIACAMTFVMIAGGFDLSVASITAVCSVVAVLALDGLGGRGAAVAIPLAIAITLAVGIVLGAANGAVIAYVGVNPFVVTLSTLLIFRGLALILSHGGQYIQVPLSLREAYAPIYWGQVRLFGSDAYAVPVPILIFLGVFLASVYLLRLTRFGHYVYAVGGNENAAWLAGVNTRLVKAATYALSGLTCAVAAVIYCSMSNTAQATSYQGLELVVIACVIVGGTPLGGGSGGLLYTLNGLLLLAVIENQLAQSGVREEYRNLLRGGIMLAVVTLDVLVRRIRSTGRR